MVVITKVSRKKVNAGSGKRGWEMQGLAPGRSVARPVRGGSARNILMTDCWI